PSRFGPCSIRRPESRGGYTRRGSDCVLRPANLVIYLRLGLLWQRSCLHALRSLASRVVPGVVLNLVAKLNDRRRLGGLACDLFPQRVEVGLYPFEPEPRDDPQKVRSWLRAIIER